MEIQVDEIVPRRDRILKATWTLDAEQDLRSVHNLTAELRLCELMYEDIVRDLAYMQKKESKTINWKKEGF